jgi:hypothetical protein
VREIEASRKRGWLITAAIMALCTSLPDPAGAGGCADYTPELACRKQGEFDPKTEEFYSCRWDTTQSKCVRYAMISQGVVLAFCNGSVLAEGTTRSASGNRKCIDDTVKLQILLNHAGFPLSNDGKLGDQTKLSITAFQKKSGIPQTGVPDVATMQALRDGNKKQ